MYVFCRVVEPARRWQLNGAPPHPCPTWCLAVPATSQLWTQKPRVNLCWVLIRQIPCCLVLLPFLGYVSSSSLIFNIFRPTIGRTIMVSIYFIVHCFFPLNFSVKLYVCLIFYIIKSKKTSLSLTTPLAVLILLLLSRFQKIMWGWN